MKKKDAKFSDVLNLSFNRENVIPWALAMKEKYNLKHSEEVDLMLLFIFFITTLDNETIKKIFEQSDLKFLIDELDLFSENLNFKESQAKLIKMFENYLELTKINVFEIDTD